MANPINWQMPANALSSQVQSTGKNGNTAPDTTRNLFNQLLTTLVQEETALLQTEAEGVSSMGLAGQGTASAATGSAGLNTSMAGLAGLAGLTGTGASSMMTDGSTALLSLLLSSNSSAGIENSPSLNPGTASNSNLIESMSPTGTASGKDENQINQAVSAAATRYGLPQSLLHAVIHQESGGNPSATSKTGAMGLMQLMPATAQALGVQNPYSIQDNIDGGAKYLTQLLHQFKGNIPLALAGYNAGPAAVTQYGGVPPYPETQNYVRNILASMSSKQSPV